MGRSCSHHKLSAAQVSVAIFERAVQLALRVRLLIQVGNFDHTEDEARACEAGNPGQVEAEDAAYIHELLLRRALHDIADKLLREER